MQRSSELTRCFEEPGYQVRYLRAKSTCTCIRCGKPAKEFSNASSRMEYSVSAICESCQKEIFLLTEIDGEGVSL